jgi:hypothetical protein
MNSITPKGHHIIVAWEDFDLDERGRQFVPGSSLVYGRTVHVPVARVIDVGPGVTGLVAGDRVVATKDITGMFTLGDLEVQSIALRTLNPRTERMDPTDEVAAVLGEAAPVAYGRRVIGTPVSAPEASDIIDGVSVDDGCERLEVVSIGSDSHGLSIGDVVLVPHQSRRRFQWQDIGRSYVSVLSDEVVAVESAPSKPGAGSEGSR